MTQEEYIRNLYYRQHSRGFINPLHLFIKERIKRDLTTAQKIVVYKFLINLELCQII